MGSSDVEFVIKANTTDAEKAVADFANRANKSLSVLELDAFLDIGQKVFEVFQKLAAVVVDFGEKAVHAASESEKAITMMNVSLKLSGNYSEDASALFEAFADQMQRTTTFTKDQVLENIALAESFNLSNDQAEKLVKAAADLSAATGRDLNSAVQLLGRSLDGHAGRLDKIVPLTKNLTFSQLQAGEAINVVAQRFNGAAEAAGNTFAGSVTKLDNAWNELLVSIGKLITQNPVILEIVHLITEAFLALSDTVKDNSQNLTQYINVGIIFPFKQVVDIIDAVRTAINFVGVAIKGVVVAFLQLPDILLKTLYILNEMVGKLVTIPGVSRALTEMHNRLEEIVQNTAQPFEDVNYGLQNLEDSATKVASSLDKIGRTQAANMRDAASQMQTSAKVIERLNQQVSAGIFTTIAANPFGTAFGQVDVDKRFGGTNKALGIGAGIAQDVVGGAAGAGKLVSGLGSAIANTIVPGLGAAIGPLLDALQKGPDATRQMVQEFAHALPEMIKNLIKAAPAFGTELIKSVPDIIIAIIEGIPDMIKALVEGAPQMIGALIAGVPRIVGSFITQFLLIPAQFLAKLLSGLGDWLSSLFNSQSDSGGLLGGGGFLGTGIGAHRGLFGTGLLNFQGGGFGIGGNKGLLGGGIIPGLFKGGAGSGADDTEQNLTVNLMISEQNLAKAILNINRQGFRTA